MTTDQNNPLPPNVARLRAKPVGKPGDPANEPVLFYAERDPAIQWRSTAMFLVLMTPLAFIAPGQFIVAALAMAATGWWNASGFRFHLGPQNLRVRAARFAPTLTVPLGEIAEASTIPDAAGFLMPMAAGSGHLVIKKTDGGQLLIPGLRNIAETVDAIRRLKQPETNEDRAAA
ncbi:MAG: hypothetical protein IT562_19610 [Alphaproteobacteria bacterium]|nr:hypothetical protein [Alphaproteobacteria bacterium]